MLGNYQKKLHNKSIFYLTTKKWCHFCYLNMHFNHNSKQAIMSFKNRGFLGFLPNTKKAL